MMLVPAGSFEMGSPLTEAGRESQEVRHRVEITHPLYIGATEVTQAQWRAVMHRNPSWFHACGPDCPVERVSWNDVQAFLAELQRSSGRPFRLPTEAEWEYSCRAGNTTPFHTGAGLSTDQANYDGEGPYDGARPGSFRRSTTPVASFAPNAFGLHDMHGKRLGVDPGLALPLPHGGRSRPARRLPHAIQGHSRRQLVLRCQQRTVRPALHTPATGLRLQHRLSRRDACRCHASWRPEVTWTTGSENHPMTNLMLSPVELQVVETPRGTWRRYLHPNGSRYAEFTSSTTVLGLPLLHYTAGISPATGTYAVARGFIAVGRRAVGVVAIGRLAAGLVAIGQAAVGAIAVGQAALGVVCLGQLALGMALGVGQVATGVVCIAQVGFGRWVLAQVGIGQHVWSMGAKDPAAIEFFRSLPARFLRLA